jgi:hypothetical protein
MMEIQTLKGVVNMGEDLEVEIIQDYEVSKYDKGACKSHQANGVLSYVVRAYSASGYESTKVCLLCLIQWYNNQ